MQSHRGTIRCGAPVRVPVGRGAHPTVSTFPIVLRAVPCSKDVVERVFTTCVTTANTRRDVKGATILLASIVFGAEIHLSLPMKRCRLLRLSATYFEQTK